MTEGTKRIIWRIAQEHNTTPEHMEAEMKAAIREGIASTDPRAQMLWRQLAPDGKEPSIDAFLDFCTGLLRQRRAQWERGQQEGETQS